MQRAHSIQSIPSSETGDSAANLLQARKSGSAEDLRSAAVSTPPKTGLPESPCFLAASKFFSEPLNDKLVGFFAKSLAFQILKPQVLHGQTFL